MATRECMLLGSNPAGGMNFLLLFCECYVLSGRGLCDELINFCFWFSLVNTNHYSTLCNET